MSRCMIMNNPSVICHLWKMFGDVDWNSHHSILSFSLIFKLDLFVSLLLGLVFLFKFVLGFQ